MLNDKFVVVYIVNDDVHFQKMAALSSLSLRLWNKEVEIVILVCGSWKLPRIPEIEPYTINNTIGIIGRFPFDKVLLTELDQYSNIIYLDSDTLVLEDITKIYGCTKKDMAARLAWVYQQKDSWDKKYEDIWRKVLSKTALEYTPIINSGVLLFRNKSHLKLRNAWTKYMKMFLLGDLQQVYGSDRHFEQLGLALAISEQRLTVEYMSKEMHGYAWVPESPCCTVYHLSSKRYDEQVHKILYKTSMLAQLEQMKSFTETIQCLSLENHD